MVKRFLALLLVALMLFATGCTLQTEIASTVGTYNPTQTKRVPSPEESGEKNETEVDPIDDSKVPPEEWTSFVKDGEAKFIVVSASTEYDNIAETLALTMGSWTHTNFTFVSGAQKAQKEPAWLTTRNAILVGEAVGNVLEEGESLRYNAELSKKIVTERTVGETTKEYVTIHITAHRKEKVNAAVYSFIDGFRHDRAYLTRENDKWNFKAPNPRILFVKDTSKYATLTPQILGRDLAEYKIVLPQNMTAVEDFLSRYLLQEIGEYTGYVMTPVDDTTAEAECEIVFGKTSRAGSQALYQTLKPGEFAIKSEGNRIYVAYENYLVSSNARGAFHRLYLNKVSEAINLYQTPDYTENNIPKNDSSFVRVMTSNIICAGDQHANTVLEPQYKITWQQRVQLQASMIMTYLPDFVGFQEIQNGNANGIFADMFNEILTNTSSEYAFVTYENIEADIPGILATGGRHNASPYWNPILYRKTVWQIEAKGVLYPEHFDTGMHRWQWALFSKIDDPNQRCIVLNLHYPTSNNAEAQLAAAELVNAQIRKLMNDYAGVPIFVTGDFNAAEGSTTYNQTVQQAYMNNANPGEGAIDLVLYNRNYAECKMAHSVYDEFIKMTSDHSPFFADFDLN